MLSLFIFLSILFLSNKIMKNKGVPKIVTKHHYSLSRGGFIVSPGGALAYPHIFNFAPIRVPTRDAARIIYIVNAVSKNKI
jgi:hypothetical protein